MTIVGIGGRLANGKDEVADYLVREHGWIKMGMSDPLHEAMMKLDPIVTATTVQYDQYDRSSLFTQTYSELTREEGYIRAKNNKEYRRLLQVFGTEVMRDMFGENVWVDIARKRIKMTHQGDINVILTGIRYENELRLIDELGGVSWWVERPGFENRSSHASESTLSFEDFDVVLMNDGSLADLYLVIEQSLRATGV